MIIDKIVAENFGVFQGRQELTLSPLRRSRPITLVGGLNGRGKTTLLDAVQLCLYGKFADCSNRGALAYGDYLKQSAHRYSDGAKSAVELHFHQRNDGVITNFRLRREWMQSGESLAEDFSVWRDGVQDGFSTENWPEIVESIMPRRIAEFFFFDGERLESYASPSKAAELLRSGVVNLLGIDLVDQLNLDLDLLKTRKAKEIRDENNRRDFLETQSEVDRLRRERDVIVAEATRLRTHELPAQEKRLLQIESEFSRMGGTLFDRAAEIEKQATKAEAEAAAIKNHMLEMAHSELPLALIMPLLTKAYAQAEAETTGAKSANLIEHLRVRDKEVLRLLANQPKTKAIIAKFFEVDLERRSRGAGGKRILYADDNYVSLLAMLATSSVPTAKKRAAELVKSARNMEQRQGRLEREKAAVPTQEAISELMERRASARATVKEIQKKLEDLGENARRLETVLARTRQSLERLAEENVRNDVSAEDSTRTINHANRVQKTLALFRARVVAQHLERIEALISDSFKTIVGKQKLFSSVSISPETFSIKLIRPDGSVITPERLSAGERQLFAVSMLWGLARASGRTLPFIIDTPLGRLDSVHRQKLLKHYFPAAGEQVVLLSTDEEIGPEEASMLDSAVRSYYVINYDHDAKGSSISEGYFKRALSNAA